MRSQVYTFDNAQIQVWRGFTGWCFAVHREGKTTGGLGYRSLESALSAARSS